MNLLLASVCACLTRQSRAQALILHFVTLKTRLRCSVTSGIYRSHSGFLSTATSTKRIATTSFFPHTCVSAALHLSSFHFPAMWGCVPASRRWGARSGTKPVVARSSFRLSVPSTDCLPAIVLLQLLTCRVPVLEFFGQSNWRPRGAWTSGWRGTGPRQKRNGAWRRSSSRSRPRPSHGYSRLPSSFLVGSPTGGDRCIQTWVVICFDQWPHMAMFTINLPAGALVGALIQTKPRTKEQVQAMNKNKGQHLPIRHAGRPADWRFPVEILGFPSQDGDFP